jgi:lipopolysaccharide export system protein LptA
MEISKLLKRPAALATAATLLCIGGAQAQIQGEGPVAVTSDNFEYVGTNAVYRGSVEAIQGQTRLRCSQLTAVFAGAGNNAGALGGGGNVVRYDCEGPVYYVTPTEQAKADAAVFTVASDTIVLTGNVTVRQGLNVAQGHRLTINTRSRNTRLESTSGASRVRTVIYPDEKGGTPARSAAPSSAPASATVPAAPAAAAAPAVASE